MLWVWINKNLILSYLILFFAVSASLRWLNNFSGCTLSRYPCFLLVSRIWDISSGIGPCFPLAGGLCWFYANAGGKPTIQRQPLLVQYKQQANTLLSMNNFTQLVISGNEKISLFNVMFKSLHSGDPPTWYVFPGIERGASAASLTEKTAIYSHPSAVHVCSCMSRWLESSQIFFCD
jgi:hypothetical protein